MTDETITHCPYCSLNCGLKLLSAGGRLTGYAPWKQSPLSAGGLCSKGITAWEQVDHAERLRSPLVRRAGRLEPASWDEALDAAADGFLRIRRDHGPEANSVLTGASLTNEKAYLVGKFARLALRTPHVDPNGRLCMSAAGRAYRDAVGLDRAMLPLEDLVGTELIVVIGANLPDAYPLVMPLISKARRRGARLIVIDPRGGKLVKDGDLHLALRPGTDRALAAALLRELDDRQAIDEAFIAKRTAGWDAAIAAARPWNLARAEATTGVPRERIREAARWIGQARRAMHLHARGAEQQLTGVLNVRGWIDVALAAGHAGRPGCGIVTLTGQRNGQGAREHGQRADQLPGYRRIDDPADRAVVAARWNVAPDDLPGPGLTYVEILAAARRSEVRGALVISTNPAVSSPRSDAAHAALAALDHLVVIDPFLSETCAFADVVLPGSTFAEDDGTVTTTDGRVVRVDQAVGPVPGRGDLDVLRGLARRLGAIGGFDFHTGREVFDELRALSADGPADYSGIDWEALRAHGGVFWPAPASRPQGTRVLHLDRFATPDGRARFGAVAPAPDADELAQPAPSGELILVTGRHRAHYLSGNQTRRIPAQLRQAPEPVLEVHPVTAAAAGLAPGAAALVTSPRGAATLSWQPNPDLRPDTLFVPYHWPGINALTDDELDPACGIAAVKRTPVRLEPAATRDVPARSVLGRDQDHAVADRSTVAGQRLARRGAQRRAAG